MKSFELKDEHILYLDNHLLVVHKPAGVLAQADKSDSVSIEDAAKAWLKIRFNKPGNVFAAVAHRLDRPVAGLVILARTSKALARMQGQFALRKIKKIYLALVSGNPPDQVHLRHWIKKRQETNKVFTYTYPRNDAQQADLYFWKAAQQAKCSMLLVRLFTGRHHQIRAQLGLEKYPIIGDVKYGDTSGLAGQPQLLSYATRFEHPVSGEELTLNTRFPTENEWRHFQQPDRFLLEMAFGMELNT